MRRKSVIILSVLVVLLSIISFLGGANKQWKNEFVAEQGVLLLADSTNFAKQGTIQLDGEWEFYEDKLLDPAAIESNKNNKEYIDVPGSWDERFSPSKSKIEAGTYRMVVQLPEDGKYGVRVNTIRHTSKVFINGVEAAEHGKTSAEHTDYQYRQGKYEAYGQSVNREAEIIIQVANYRHPNGGIIKPISFGDEAQIKLLADRSKVMDGFVFSGFVLLAIIFFSNFIQNKSKHELYFALFSLAQAIYISTGNEKLIYLVFPYLSNDNLLSIQLVFINLSALFFLLFISSMFRKYAKFRIVKLLVILLSLQVFYYVIPIRIYNIIPFFPIGLSQIYLIIMIALPYLYFILILLRAFKDRVAGTEYLLLAATSLICYGVSLWLDLLFAIDVDQLTLLLFFLMGIGFSFFIAYQRRLVIEKLDGLSMELLVQEQLKDESLLKTSKELIQPIEDILQSSTVLMEGEKGPLKLEQQELIYAVKNSGNQLAQLVEKFNNAVADKERLTLKVEPVHLKIINEMVDELSFLLKYSDEVVIENQISMNLPCVMANENSLKQIMLHLLENAIENTESGKIIVTAREMGEMIRVSVDDSGKGIEEKYIPYIFDTFYQVPEAGSKEAGGIGLGLSITKKFVTLMGGEIWAESIPDVGARFIFTLPIAENAEGTVDSLSREIEEKSKGLREESMPEKIAAEVVNPKVILLADADYDHLSHMTSILSQSGYTVITVNKGADVTAVLQKEHIDLAVIDIKMSDVSGLELSKIIREEHNQVELPILLLSSLILKADKNSSLQAGVNDFIRKPVAESEFLSRIQSLLAVQDAVQQSINHELKAYHAQITPHFLFNTLNTIIGLSYQDEKKTREALSYLAIYFRAKLDFQKQQSLVPLYDEIELVQAYLAIEKLRFGDQLMVHYDIDEAVQTLIPAMTIQPLVENAIQHGLSRKIDGATFRLSIREEEGFVIIKIEDNGIGISKEKQEQLLHKESQRFGFKNPFEKLKLIKNSSFELHSEEGKGTRICIRLEVIR